MDYSVSDLSFNPSTSESHESAFGLPCLKFKRSLMIELVHIALVGANMISMEIRL